MQKTELKMGRSPVAKRLDGVSESATLKLNATVQAMKAKGEDVVNLTAGEPDFNVPDVAKNAVIESLQKNRSKYTPAAGIPELRQAVADKTNAQHEKIGGSEAPWKGSHVVVTNGGKQAIFNALMSLLDPGDEVLIPTPYWLSYPEMVKLCGGIPKFIPSSFASGFKITPEQLENALSPKVKALILNSPNNPTGAMYSRNEYQALAEVIAKSEAPERSEKNVDGNTQTKPWIISDEIYDRIVLGDTPFCSFLNAAPSLRDRTVTVNGMSKSAAMTGWRIGWSVAPEELTSAMVTLQGQSTSGINSLAQWASLAALKLPDSYYAEAVQIYQKRCKLMLENLKKARKIEIMAPAGAFYVFIGVQAYLRPAEDSISFAQRVLEEAKVALVPGTPFGEPQFLRLSFATDDESIQKGCERLVKYLEK